MKPCIGILKRWFISLIKGQNVLRSQIFAIFEAQVSGNLKSSDGNDFLRAPLIHGLNHLTQAVYSQRTDPEKAVIASWAALSGVRTRSENHYNCQLHSDKGSRITRLKPNSLYHNLTRHCLVRYEQRIRLEPDFLCSIDFWVLQYLFQFTTSLHRVIQNGALASFDDLQEIRSSMTQFCETFIPRKSKTNGRARYGLVFIKLD